MDKKKLLDVLSNVSIIILYIVSFIVVFIMFSNVINVDGAVIRGGALGIVGFLLAITAFLLRKKAQNHQNIIMDKVLKVFFILSIITACFGVCTFVANLLEVLL